MENAADVPSPALLVYPDRIRENIRRMIALASNPARLRPHVKTHKLPEVIRLQLHRGITRFKCSTIAEAEMVAASGAPDILLAYQPVGPGVRRLIQLALTYPQSRFSTMADDPEVIRHLSDACVKAGMIMEVLLDIDGGMHRSGVPAGPRANELYRWIEQQPGLRPGGLHIYDGHIRESNIAARTIHCETDFAPVRKMWKELQEAGLRVPRVVAGGTPTFPVHARDDRRECSPGTCILWDISYGQLLPDLDFLPAAFVLTRVISKPGGGRLCLDLGYKAIASENPIAQRVTFPRLPDAQPVLHNEEHLVVETAYAKNFQVGDPLYGVPWHICPTTALYAEVVAVEEGQAAARWKVVARDRALEV